MLRHELAGDDGDDALEGLGPEVSIEVMRAWANGLRRNSRCSIPGSDDVVEVVALAADEAGVLRAA